MANQRKNAGNIGDIIKHAILPEVIAEFNGSHTGKWSYCETHAGYYNYSLALLRNQKGVWSGERAWGIGMIQPEHHEMLGHYGKQLSKALPMGCYPGSICLAESTTSDNARIVGRDLGDEQVVSFQGKSRIEVTKGDGYADRDV